MSHLKKLYQEFSCSKLSPQIVVCLCGLFILGIITPAKAISNSYTGVNKIQNTDSITNLLAQRKELIQQNKSTIEIDKQLKKMGYLPTAIVSKIANQTSLFLNFEFYHELNQNRTANFITRLKQMFPELKELEMDAATYAVRSEFIENISAERLNSFFLIYGYNGYETK